MDYTVTISGAFIGAVLVAIVGYVMKTFITEKMKEIRARRMAFESHIALCSERATAFALLEQKVRDIKDQVDADRKTRDWLGDSIVKIAAKMDVELTERPK